MLPFERWAQKELPGQVLELVRSASSRKLAPNFRVPAPGRTSFYICAFYRRGCLTFVCVSYFGTACHPKPRKPWPVFVVSPENVKEYTSYMESWPPRFPYNSMGNYYPEFAP